MGLRLPTYHRYDDVLCTCCYTHGDQILLQLHLQHCDVCETADSESVHCDDECDGNGKPEVYSPCAAYDGQMIGLFE